MMMRSPRASLADKVEVFSECSVVQEEELDLSGINRGLPQSTKTLA